MRDQLTAVFLALVAMGLSLTSSLAGSTSERLTTRDGIPWLRYLPAEGVQDGPIPGVVAEAPQGLEALYGWMTEPRDDTDARLFRMPNGRLLVSCSRTEVGVDISPEEMIRIWPEIAAKLVKNAQYVDDGADNASTRALAGREWLYIRTKAVLDGDKMLSVELECHALCQEGVMIEIWQAWPAAAAYKYDDEAVAELQADLETAAKWLQGVSLPEG